MTVTPVTKEVAVNLELSHEELYVLRYAISAFRSKLGSMCTPGGEETLRLFMAQTYGFDKAKP